MELLDSLGLGAFNVATMLSAFDPSVAGYSRMYDFLYLPRDFKASLLFALATGEAMFSDARIISRFTDTRLSTL